MKTPDGSTPSILPMANASSPLKAPATDAALKDSLSQLHLLTLIPFGRIVCHAGEKSGLRDAEKDACRKQATVVRDDVHQSHDHAPCHYGGGQPGGRTDFLEHEVARYFKGGVREEGDQTLVVFVVGQLEVLLETLDLGITDYSGFLWNVLAIWKREHGTDGVRTVKEGEEVEQHQHQDKSYIHLFQPT